MLLLFLLLGSKRQSESVPKRRNRQAIGVCASRQTGKDNNNLKDAKTNRNKVVGVGVAAIVDLFFVMSSSSLLPVVANGGGARGGLVFLIMFCVVALDVVVVLLSTFLLSFLLFFFHTFLIF